MTKGRGSTRSMGLARSASGFRVMIKNAPATIERKEREIATAKRLEIDDIVFHLIALMGDYGFILIEHADFYTGGKSSRGGFSFEHYLQSNMRDEHNDRHYHFLVKKQMLPQYAQRRTNLLQ
jgi:hypothetical protein